MLYDGLGYFFVLTGMMSSGTLQVSLIHEFLVATNVFNLILFRMSDRALQVCQCSHLPALIFIRFSFLVLGVCI